MKPRLVLTGRHWPRTYDGYADIAKVLDFSFRLRKYYLPVGSEIYEYSVQYQTPKIPLANEAQVS